MKIFLHILIFVFLTLVTQIGGVVYVMAILLIRKSAERKHLKRLGMFTGLYLIATFLIIPHFASVFGREKIKETEFLKAHSWFYKIANRNYVRPELNQSIQKIATEFEKRNLGIKMIYLDANFPFLDNFPLLPHLSHKDGKKIDVSFIYENKDGKLSNKKKSLSGYGVYEKPTDKEFDQNAICKNQGNWQYDFPKYLTLGTINKEVQFSERGTQDLIELILKQNNIKIVYRAPFEKSPKLIK